MRKVADDVGHRFASGFSVADGQLVLKDQVAAACTDFVLLIKLFVCVKPLPFTVLTEYHNFRKNIEKIGHPCLNFVTSRHDASSTIARPYLAARGAFRAAALIVNQSINSN
jgi:hypothetical protein